MNASESTARNLLTAYFTLLQYSPDTSTWSLENFAGNRVRSGYLQQVQALARAVAVPVELLTNPDWYAESVFARRPDGWQTELVREIETAVAEPGQEQTGFYERLLGPVAPQHRARHEQEVKAYYQRDFDTIYTQCLRFLRLLQPVMRFNKDWLMAGSAGARFSIQTTGAVLAGVDPQAIERLLQFLARLIDPANRYHSLNELVEHFGFPATNMEEAEAADL